MNKKWMVAIGVTVGAMVFGLAAVAAAPYVAQAQSAATATPGTAGTTVPGYNTGPGNSHRPGGFQGPREREALVSATASVTGLTAPEVQTQLQAGQSLAQIAQAKGKTAADVIAAARTALTTQLAQDVTAGKITQAQSDAQLANFDKTAPQIVADTTLGTKGGSGFGFGRGGPGGPGGAGALINATASVTGLTDQEVGTQLRAGQSLAQIAVSKGKTADDVIAAARTALTTQLAQAVTAGKITQAQSDAKLAQFNSTATQVMNDATLGQHAGGPGGPGGQNGPRGAGGPGGLIQATASVTGLTDQEVQTQLQAGQSLAQIAVSKGKTADDVIAAARTALTTQLAADVTAGRITQAQSDARLAQFNSTATQLVNDTTLGQHAGGPGGQFGPGGAGALIQATASVTGLTNQAVRTQLQAGQSLAQIAQSKGKTADDVIAAARTALTTQLAQEVTAGHITQAQSDARLAQFNTNATQLVNDVTLGQHAGRPGGPGGHWGGPHGPNGQNNPANPTPTAPAVSTATNP